MPPYVVVSNFKKDPNGCSGQVLHANKLYDCAKVPDKTLVFLEEADGTEEIPSHNIQAIILKHDLPQLSHLAIRAR